MLNFNYWKLYKLCSSITSVINCILNCNFRLSTYNLNANMPAEVIVQLLNTELAQKLLILHVNVFTGIGILANISPDRSYVVLNVEISIPCVF